MSIFSLSLSDCRAKENLFAEEIFVVNSCLKGPE